jgi:hypothetical protein
VSAAEDVGVPAQHGVRFHQQPHPTQGLLGEAVEQGGEEGPVCGREAGAGSVELALQYGELVS